MGLGQKRELSGIIPTPQTWAGVPTTPQSNHRAPMPTCFSSVIFLSLHTGKYSSTSHSPCGISGLDGSLESIDPFLIQILEQNLASGPLFSLFFKWASSLCITLRMPPMHHITAL